MFFIQLLLFCCVLVFVANRFMALFYIVSNDSKSFTQWVIGRERDSILPDFVGLAAPFIVTPAVALAILAAAFALLSRI